MTITAEASSSVRSVEPQAGASKPGPAPKPRAITSTPPSVPAPLRLELAAAALVPSAAIGFVRIFADGAAVLPLIGGALLSTVLAVAARRARVPLVASALLSLGVLVALVTRQYAPGTGRAGFVPDGESLRALRTVLDLGIDAYREQKAPVESLEAFIAAALIACWIMAFLTDWGALRLRLAFEPVLPAGLLFIFSAVLGSGDHRLFATAVFSAAVLVWAVVQRATDLQLHAVWLKVDRKRGPADLARNGLILGSLALIAGLVVGPLLPGAESSELYTWRNAGDPVRQVISPYVSIEAQLKEQSSVRLFTVRSDRPAYWRLAGLDTYEDGRWTTQGSFEPEDGDLPGLRPRSGTTLTVRQDFTIEKLDAIWLPAAFAPARVLESDANVTWNRDTGSLTVDGRRDTSDGVIYSIESVIPLYTADELRAADGVTPSAISDHYLLLPTDLNPRIGVEAASITAGATTTYDQMLALQNHFRAFEYSIELSARSGDPIDQFLDERVGFCQQFSGTFALMARALGVPARVAVGFTWGDPVAGEEGLYSVSGRQAHAWPEVWFPELGWVSFEPTPGRGAPDAPYNSAPATQDSLIQPDNPGQATTTIGGGLGGPLPSGRPLDFDPGLGLPEQGTGLTTFETPQRSFPVWLLALLGLTGAYLVSVPLWHRLRRARRTHRAASPRDRIDAAWANAAEAIETTTGLLRPPATTRVTWAHQLRNDIRIPGEPLHLLAEIVTRGRFDPAHEPTSEEVDRAEHAASEITHAVYRRLAWSQRWRAELDPRRLLKPTARPLASG